MKKSEILDKIRTAKRSHISWVKRAHALIDGVPLDKEKVPVKPTDCDFGTWYYDEGQILSNIDAFKEIESSHNQLHHIYAEIFKLLFEENEPSFFERLLGTSATPKQENIEEANKLFHELQKISDVIVYKLEMLEQEIKDI